MDDEKSNPKAEVHRISKKTFLRLLAAKAASERPPDNVLPFKKPRPSAKMK